jgi:serine/threonine protein phosphatase PrpC
MTEITLHGLRFDVGAISEQGPRAENQDAYSIDRFADAGLLALADGMGGEKSGRAAADTALEALRSHLPIRSVDDARRAVRDADRIVSLTAESDPARYGGMGAALGVIALTNGGDGPGWLVANVGDVRVLSLSPDGVLRLETRDHTPAFARWEAGEISLDEIPDSAGANRLQRAIGRGGEPDVAWVPAAPGWSWVIISDGVYKAMRLDELAAALAEGSAEEACLSIRRKVNERGPDDNFTAIVVRAVGGPSARFTSIPITDMTLESPSSVPHSGSSRGAGVALAIAVLALVLAGVAFWIAREASENAVADAEVIELRQQIDSLKAMLGDLSDPFAPTPPSSGAPATTTQPGLGR